VPLKISPLEKSTVKNATANPKSVSGMSGKLCRKATNACRNSLCCRCEKYRKVNQPSEKQRFSIAGTCFAILHARTLAM